MEFCLEVYSQEAGGVSPKGCLPYDYKLLSKKPRWFIHFNKKPANFAKNFKS
jgi:hypothetical protein